MKRILIGISLGQGMPCPSQMLGNRCAICLRRWRSSLVGAKLDRDYTAISKGVAAPGQGVGLEQVRKALAPVHGDTCADAPLY